MTAYQTQLWMAGAIGCACCQANGVAPPHSPPPAVPPVALSLCAPWHYVAAAVLACAAAAVGSAAAVCSLTAVTV